MASECARRSGIEALGEPDLGSGEPAFAAEIDATRQNAAADRGFKA
jgi:hypothetical protein